MPRETIVTPVGRAMYPHLNAPDTKFCEGDKSQAKYGVTLVCDTDTPGVMDLINRIQDAYDEHAKKAKKARKNMNAVPFFHDEDKGEVEFRFGSKAYGRNKTTGEEFERKPLIVDTKRVRIKDCPLIGNGSRIRVSFFLSPYESVNWGVSLKLKGVQIIELVEYDGAASDFDEEEGGYVASEDQTKSDNSGGDIEDDTTDF